VVLRTSYFRGQTRRALVLHRRFWIATTFNLLAETGSPPTGASRFRSESIISGTTCADRDRKRGFWMKSVPLGLAS
jgi:hypothetical protein